MFFEHFTNRGFSEEYQTMFNHLGINNIDVYHQALFYTLGICDETRNNFTDLYDSVNRSIKTDGIGEGWQTSISTKVTRLAFNLFTDQTPTAIINETGRERYILFTMTYQECQQYSVSDIFCCEYAPYFIEAIKIRYPEYFAVCAYDV